MSFMEIILYFMLMVSRQEDESDLEQDTNDQPHVHVQVSKSDQCQCLDGHWSVPSHGRDQSVSAPVTLLTTQTMRTVH